MTSTNDFNSRPFANKLFPFHCESSINSKNSLHDLVPGITLRPSPPILDQSHQNTDSEYTSVPYNGPILRPTHPLFPLSNQTLRPRAYNHQLSQVQHSLANVGPYIMSNQLNIPQVVSNKAATVSRMISGNWAHLSSILCFTAKAGNT